MDFGMERCVLALRLPSLDMDPSMVIRNGSIELCELDVSRMLDTRTLSWKKRPKCRQNLGTFIPVAGEEVTLHEFSCAWGILPTFEASCSSDSPECTLDVWGGIGKAWGK